MLDRQDGDISRRNYRAGFNIFSSATVYVHISYNTKVNDIFCKLTLLYLLSYLYIFLTWDQIKIQTINIIVQQ